MNAPSTPSPDQKNAAPPTGSALPAFEPTPLTGLSAAEAAARASAGLANTDAAPKTKTIGQIIAGHTFTLFNGINLLLAILVFITGSYRNMLFMMVVFLNTLIGIVQEVRSKRAIDKLAILARRPVRVRRDGKTVELPTEDIVLGDLVLLKHGDQVPADLTVREGTASLNESLLTGESKPVAKAPGDPLMSGSFVVSGSLVAEATAVGAASYANRLSAEAKTAKRVDSEILSTLQLIIKFATWVLVPVGILLYLRSVADGLTINNSILTTVAAVVGMIPQGLVLLTSTVLAISTMRLALNHVLVQQLYCIEELARVDVLCLDKTGTITTGQMCVSACVPATPYTKDQLEQAVVSVMAASKDDANETARAVLAYQEAQNIQPLPAARAVPFSSERKYSGCVVKDGSAFVVGALQYIFGSQEELLAPARKVASPLARLLVVAEVDGFDEKGAFLGEPRFMGTIVIQDEVRATAPATLAYFREQGVELKIISGDDPKTVAAIAEEAGVPGAHKYCDATTLTTPEALTQAAADTVVFGRVTPQQKRDLVLALKAQGHAVAMTGDGVNDVLALREADCSVAMASGSDAARAVAEIVLVDSDFAHMPEVVGEGRRSINNLQRSAALFLEKTVFSMVVALLCIVLPPYPFLPIQMSLVSTAVIGIPSFVLALEPNHERVRGHFLANVLARSMPASIAISLALACVVGVREVMGLTAGETSTMATCLAALIGIALVIRIARPLNPLRTALLVVITAWMVLGVTIFGSFFEVARLSWLLLVCMVVIGSVSLVVFVLTAKASEPKPGQIAAPYVRFSKRVEERHHDKSAK